MKFYKCKKCGQGFLERKFRCSCGSIEFVEETMGPCRVIYSIMLTVPPKNYPDMIYLNLVNNDKVKVFCYSIADFRENEEVTVADDDGKIICKKKDIM